jgi:hypothetical protein
MQKTAIVIVTHRGCSDDTYECVTACKPAAVLKIKGIAYVDRARNYAFDRTLETFEAADASGIDIDMALMVDDDMFFDPTTVQRLVDNARASQHPRSARYITESGTLAGAPYPGSPLRWAYGFGCMAIPRRSLERVAPTLPRLGDMRLWVQTGAHPVWPDCWIGEDFWFATHFDGVDLDNFATVGHQKQLILYPAGPNGGVRVASNKRKV